MMKDLHAIEEYLSKTLSEKRYVHSINTARYAEKLAAIYGYDGKKAYLAGLVHDCTREMDMKLQHQLLAALNIRVDELSYNTRELIHAYTAEYVIKNEFHIYDEEIIAATKFHTTGKEAMTLLEKIIFLADVIEPSRSFPGVDYIRRLAEKNLNEALIEAFDSSIRFLLGKRSLIHPNTFLARNYVLLNLKE